MEKSIEELTLLLMYLTSWDEKGYIEDENNMPKEAKIKTSWKGYSFDVINKLTEESYLYFSKYKNKSVSLTPKGEELAKKLILISLNELIGQNFKILNSLFCIVFYIVGTKKYNFKSIN